jgi:hypothetical protein
MTSGRIPWIVLTVLLLSNVPAGADLNDCAVGWDSFANFPGFISEYTYQGQIVADEETSADTSHGPAAVPPDQTDLASGSPSNYPGPEATSFFGYYNGGTPYDPNDPNTMEDDYILFRMRVEGDPNQGAAFDSKHWNVLFDVDADGYKEYWVDLNGSVASGNNNPDHLQILYDNNSRQDIPDSDVARVERFTAYYDPDGDASCPAGSPGLSHTRVIDIGDGTGDYWIEMQVPMTAFNDGAGNQILFPNSPVAFVFSTGASNQDPLQKDWMHDLDFLTLSDPITFGDIIIPNGQPIIEFTDVNLDPVNFYTIGDGVYVYLKDPLANTDSDTVECIAVTVTNPAVGDDETVTLCETGPGTGIFTNRGGACKAEITNPDPPPEPPTAWIPSVVTSDSAVDESWTATYDAANTNWIVTGSVSGVQTGRATAGTAYTSDGGEISLTIYENLPVDGTVLSFCTRGADPLPTSENNGSDDDGDLQVFDGDEITVSYTSPNLITVTDTADIIGPCSSFIQFTRANGLPSEDFELTEDSLYITVFHAESNTNPAVAETIQVVLTGHDTQTLTLTETGPDTGEFRNTTGLPTQTDDGVVTAEDGLWEDIDQGVITATFDYICGGQNYSTSNTASLFYIDAGGRVYFTNGAGTEDVELYGSSQPIFVRVTDANACVAADGTITAVITNGTGDSETLTLHETAPGSGVFMNRLNDLVTTSGSAVVTSATSTFVTDGVQAGDTFVIATGPDVGTYTVSSVDSETQITLNTSLTTSRTDISFNASPLMTATSDGTLVADDQVFESVHNETVTVSYTDCDDGDLDGSNDTKTDTATYNDPPLLINEVLFYPDPSPDSCQTEAVELLNSTSVAIQATGYELTDGDAFSYTIPSFQGSNLMLQPGERIFLSLWDAAPPPDFYFVGTYYLFASVGTSLPSNQLGDPTSPDLADQMMLFDASGIIQDYVGWSATLSPSLDFLGDDSPAVLSSIWQDDAFRDVAAIPIDNSIARTTDGFDTNQPSDWEFSANNECEFIITRAVISGFRAVRERGRTVVEWSTSSEDGTLGFYLFRKNPRSKQFTQVNRNIVPALLDSPQGGDYRLEDPRAKGSKITYSLLEIESAGNATQKVWHGPYEVEIEKSTRTNSRRAMRRGEATPRSMTPRQRKRLDARRSERSQGPHRSKRDRGQGNPGRSVGVKTKLKISVEDAGLYSLETLDLASRFGVSQATMERVIRNGLLRMRNRGRYVAWTESQDQERILFWGQPIESIYTRENVYWLEVRKGRRMTGVRGKAPRPADTEASFLETLHIEQDVFPATMTARDPESDYWFWNYVSSGHPIYSKQSYVIDVADLATTATRTGMLAVRLHSINEGVHRVVVRLNGAHVGEGRWEGIRSFSVSLPVDPSWFAAGENAVELEGLLDPGAPLSMFFVDSIDVSYPRRYRAVDDRLQFRSNGNSVVTVSGFTEPTIMVLDITRPHLPRRIESTTVDSMDGGFRVSFRPDRSDGVYVAQAVSVVDVPKAVWPDRRSRLRSPSNGAEYIVIVPEELEEAAGLLAEHRRASGLETKVVLLEDVMDEFNSGISNPHAIRSFLAHAYTRWNRPPRFVALGGSGTLDYKNNYGLADNLVPPLMVNTPDGLYASDNLFADIDEDGVPDIAVGRIPVLTSAELEAYIAKLAAYEASLGAPWRNRVLLAADNNPNGDGNFAHDSESMAALLPWNMTAQRIYLSEIPVQEARASLIEEMRRGAMLVNYVGHGGLDRMADENLFHSNDVASLGNADKYPILTGFSCSLNRYELSGFVSLGEVMTVEPNGGAAAVWAPSGLSRDTDARILGNAFFRAVFKRGAATLGEAVVQATREYAESRAELFLIDIYNLLGDPAIPLY